VVLIEACLPVVVTLLALELDALHIVSGDLVGFWVEGGVGGSMGGGMGGGVRLRVGLADIEGEPRGSNEEEGKGQAAQMVHRMADRSCSTCSCATCNIWVCRSPPKRSPST